jgi:dextranase
MRKKVWLLIGITILIVGFGVGVSRMIENNRYDFNGLEITITGTDKSMYPPKDTANISYILTNTSEKEKKDISIVLKVMHLEQLVTEIPVQTVSLASEEQQKLEYQYTVPEDDFTGYLLEIGIVDQKGNFVVSDTVGLDVSSSWVKFPRYGYLADFGKDVDTESKIQQMNRYHINGIEYYDWHYLHHQPLADGVTAESPGSWKDWSGREISGETVVNYIQEAKERNMVNMAYNMIYAGTDTFFKDQEGNPTKANDWKLYFAENNDRGEGNFTFYMGTSPSGNGNLYFLNPLNKEWQKHIFSEELKIFSALGFDGWHGDTVGDWGEMVTAKGEPLGYHADGTPIYLVKDTYTQFLNAAKEALGEKYLSFNPVGAQGIENANVSQADVLYTEFWPWDNDREGRPYDTYASLVREVERSNEDSKSVSFDGKGKSLVVKAYINYYKTNGFMNAPGVLLADAAVYAAGGSRLELGNGERMLHVEYYPDDDILMDEELTEKMRNMADFIVAYENLLRDGQWTSENLVSVEGYAYGKEGASDTIWTYTRADSQYDILHLINLLGTDNQWRDERGKKNIPTEVRDIPVTYYTDKDITAIYLASPDVNDSRSKELSFEKGEDSNGSYIQFNVPFLQYWDMIYMK